MDWDETQSDALWEIVHSEFLCVLAEIAARGEDPAMEDSEVRALCADHVNHRGGNPCDCGLCTAVAAWDAAEIEAMDYDSVLAVIPESPEG